MCMDKAVYYTTNYTTWPGGIISGPASCGSRPCRPTSSRGRVARRAHLVRVRVRVTVRVRVRVRVRVKVSTACSCPPRVTPTAAPTLALFPNPSPAPHQARPLTPTLPLPSPTLLGKTIFIGWEPSGAVLAVVQKLRGAFLWSAPSPPHPHPPPPEGASLGSESRRAPALPARTLPPTGGELA